MFSCCIIISNSYSHIDFTSLLFSISTLLMAPCFSLIQLSSTTTSKIPSSTALVLRWVLIYEVLLPFFFFTFWLVPFSKSVIFMTNPKKKCKNKLFNKNCIYVICAPYVCANKKSNKSDINNKTKVSMCTHLEYIHHSPSPCQLLI